MTAKQSKNFLLLFTAAVIWGVAFVAQSVGMDYVGPLYLQYGEDTAGRAGTHPLYFPSGQKKCPEGRQKGSAVKSAGPSP